ncbi:MAG: formate dehydrogenase accessory sulfurtransferase FdhD [Burkholderiaceae bacterium]|nr:formate dehydrogenase accessory sulfurtransferase FdhD [Burkholderiaceae bacterium]
MTQQQDPDRAPSAPARPRPQMTDAGLRPAHAVSAVDEYGRRREGFIAGERPLTLYLDKREIVTLMTLGTHPELLVLGYLLNQRLIEDPGEVRAIQVDWDVDAAAVTTWNGTRGIDEKLAHRTVTSGCGQGTMFGRLADELDSLSLARPTLHQSRLYALLRALNDYNEVYRRAGAVHGCALCRLPNGDGEADAMPAIELFVEDVGRHNAADAIAAHMRLDGLDGSARIFYTTGRLTSEMVIKVAQMRIPVLLSRSGITQKGLELAQRVGVMMLARARGRHFLVYHGAERLVFDAIPPMQAGDASGGPASIAPKTTP